ncbi:transcriptional regulator [Bdellovibrio sp. HCB185ZH]|uniref:transcriptional regulator n=1 Tax=Bdellovibrio sp. HCB185ZH TaxID=3394235 RepID=UPI0039A50A04
MTHLPGHAWQDLKKELMEKWHELTENDLDSTRGNTHSIVDLLERKVGMRIEEASERFAEIASHYHLYEEPEEEDQAPVEPKEERTMELSPKTPSSRPDVLPKP